MKRHSSLIPLSREHHQNLILAQLLKSDVKDYKGMPDTPEAKASYALNEFNSGIKDHFRKEELILNGLSHYSELREISHEIFEEHKELSALFLSLSDGNVTVKLLDDLGHKLYDHIRKEDRVLFPLIESLCTDEEFEKISNMW